MVAYVSIVLNLKIVFFQPVRGLKSSYRAQKVSDPEYSGRGRMNVKRWGATGLPSQSSNCIDLHTSNRGVTAAYDGRAAPAAKS